MGCLNVNLESHELRLDDYSMSLTLTGNKSKPALDSKGKASKHHVWLYTADAVRNHPDVALTRGGLVLIALLSGGDYDGVSRFVILSLFNLTEVDSK